MRTKLELFGMRIDLATQARRRRLVVVFYGACVWLLVANWVMGSHTGGGWFTIIFTLMVGPLLGGYFASVSGISGGRGLVEPFRPTPVLVYPKSTSIFEPSTLLHPVVDKDPELRVDERALRRRDYAHYVSHGFLSGVVAVGFILEYLSNSDLLGDFARIGLNDRSVNRIVYCLLQMGYIASMTLPQAVLIWTEPDMEPEAKVTSE